MYVYKGKKNLCKPYEMNFMFKSRKVDRASSTFLGSNNLKNVAIETVAKVPIIATL